MKHGIRSLCVAFVVTGLSVPVSADLQMPAFGPQSFELTAGQLQLFTESFASEVAGEFVLHLRNGDGESSRVSGVSVVLNGASIVMATELTGETAGLKRPVLLQAGNNELVVETEGPPGSFVTIVVAAVGEQPVFVSGRLLLPWGRNDGEHLLSLALKNDSRKGPRVFKVIFYNPGGEIVAASEKLPLPPQGSVAFPIDEVIAKGAWQAGSLEIIYTGPGKGRLFGSAKQIDLSPIPQSETVALEQAGMTVSEGQPRLQGRPRPRPGL